jgi:glycosyltransferase involved in cell wall biosynthesis/peptidoglycan/xylan/chitin deacetylase (PgdA/CDA1 family)
VRVVFLTPSLGPGGSEGLTVAYALGMRGRGHEVVVAFGFGNWLGAPLAEAGITLADVSARRLGWMTLPEWVYSLRRLFRSYRPDVIHAQSITASLAARLAAPDVPQLVTVHGIDAENEALAALILRLSARRVMAVSEATAAGLHRFPWAPPVELMLPAVDLGALSAAAAEQTIELPGRPAFCCVARQEHVKGQDILLRAFPAVLAELPDAVLTFLGFGREFERNRELAASLGLGERVRFLGYVPNAAPYLRAADVVVLPSRREGLPVVALEALGLERPLVATDVGGTSTVVLDGETGWLVPPEDETALAAALCDCARNAEESRRRARRGRELVQTEFGAPAMLDRLESSLLSLAGLSAAVPPTKPRLYYRAVGAHQSSRIAAARRDHSPREQWQGVRIFGYHRVADEPRDVYAIAPRAFRAQMEHLLASGTTLLRLDAALELLQRPVEGQYACVSFDDGYRDFLDHALPTLELLQIPATVFGVTGFLAGRTTFSWYHDPPGALSWDDVPRLLETGLVDLQAHSSTHRQMTRLSDKDLESEVAAAKRELERHLPYTVTSFSYPAGLYSPREMRAVEAAGFRGAVTTRPGVNPGGTGLGDLRRTMIHWRDDARDFAAKLDGALDRPSWIASTIYARRIAR